MSLLFQNVNDEGARRALILWEISKDKIKGRRIRWMSTVSDMSQK